MANFTVNLVRDTDSTEGMLCRFYTCRMFDCTEAGTLTLYGFNGSEEDIHISLQNENYTKLFIMNGQGNTVFSKRMDTFFYTAEVA